MPLKVEHHGVVIKVLEVARFKTQSGLFPAKPDASAQEKDKKMILNEDRYTNCMEAEQFSQLTSGSAYLIDL